MNENSQTQTTTNDIRNGEQLLNEHALAARWAISVRTLQNQRVSGRGTAFVKIGRSVRYKLSDIRAFETLNIRASTSELREVRA